MSARTSTYEASIVGDEQEQYRIQMEQQLQHTEISFHLSSTPDDCSDVEYPRHRSDPHSFSGLPSFEHPSREAFPVNDPTAPWSYRTMDDDDAIHPFAGETVSTTAHHASALTLSAGLGGRGARRDMSLSGAEYDPDRPLQGIMAGLDARYNKQTTKSSQSKNMISTMVDFDPLVVEDTVELDNILHTCNVERCLPIHSSISSGTSSASGSGRATPLPPQSPRPTLTDALSRGTFSPQRPRSAQVNSGRRTPISNGNNHTSFARGETPRNRTHQSLSYVGQAMSPAAAAEPAVNILPPTPLRDDKTVRFMGKTRNKNEFRAVDSIVAPVPQHATRRSHLSQPEMNQPHRDRAGSQSNLGETGDLSIKTPRSALRNKVHLPDVTGLTSAIASPARKGWEFYGVNTRDEREVDAHLIATLSAVQAKLAHLESENSISRRRVRELELELEECKKEVMRERTKILEQSSFHPVKERQQTPGKGLGRAKTNLRGVSFDPEVETTQKRYQEVVEEKKALEGLISTLRAHLSRLTAELSDHRRLLAELRTLRDRDSQALKEKSMEVDHLRQEVERLAGEVVVLRGVVEEGLKERREIKEQHSARSSHMDDASEVLDDNQNSNDSRSDVSAGDMSTIHAAQSKYAAHTSLLSPPSSRPASRSSHRGALPSSIEHSLAHDAGEEEEPFISSAEMDRISQELSERRTERSISAYSGKSPSASREMQSQVRRDPPAKTSSRRPFEVPPRESKLDPVNVQAATRGSSGHRNAADPRLQRQPSAGSSSAPGLQKQKLQQYDDGHEYKMDPLLSRIPAARLDCPSGPSHEPQTCTICHRRRLRQRKPAADGEEEPWIRELDARIGKISSQGTAPQGPTKTIGNIPQRTRDPADDKLPPQTVLTKVLRELEDDFVHYKAIYIELADQYKVVDPASNPAKRNVLADHLRDVIDLLEQKGDQIASLYDLLTFKDKSIPAAQKS